MKSLVFFIEFKVSWTQSLKKINMIKIIYK
jgi:hypothetical protein